MTRTRPFVSVPSEPSRGRATLCMAFALLGGCSLSVDFERAPPIFDAGSFFDAAPDGAPSFDAMLRADAQAHDGTPADGTPADGTPGDAARLDGHLDFGTEDGGLADASVATDLNATPDAAPPPEPCLVDGERRAVPCHAEAEFDFANPEGTLGARRVEVCREGHWTVTVACAHAPPVACAVACGHCPKTAGDTMPIELGTLQSPEGSTFDLYYRFPVSAAAIPTDYPVDLIGWLRSDAWFLVDERHVRQIRTLDALGHQATAERRECVPVDGIATCVPPGRFVDTPAQAGRRYVLREHFRGQPGNEVALERDVIRLTPDGTRIDRIMTAALPAGPLEAQEIEDLDAQVLGPNLTYIYHYDDPTALPLPSSVTTKNLTGTLTETREYQFDDGGRPVALTFYTPALDDEPVRVTQQRQIDTTCFDCGPSGCQVSELASLCTWVGFMAMPTGLCEPPWNQNLDQEQAAEQCRFGRTPEAAEREGYSLARLPDGVALAQVVTRLRRLGRYADGLPLAVWVGAKRVEGNWRWHNGDRVDGDLLSPGCDDTAWPEGAGLMLHPDREGLCGAPDPTKGHFGALCQASRFEQD